MGVRGLTTYINYNQDSFLQKHFLHNCDLVIDGNSLCAQLYGRLKCFSAFGGDYDKFALFVRNFFKGLRKCHVNPYLLFDGSYEGKKLKTAYNRLRSKIYGASRLDPVTQNCLKIFPLLFRDVFKEVLIEMSIPFTVCEFEADNEIAAMAKFLECPVLSYDSDFFVYNVLYIPFNTLDFKPTQIEQNGVKINVMECKIYQVQYMLNNFGGLKIEMLPLLATLLGNDYVEKKVFHKFFSHLKLPKSKKKMNEQQRCINGIFKWLQTETLDSAVSKILGRLKKKHKRRVLSIINKSISSYNRKYCHSLKYFNLESQISTDADDVTLTVDDSIIAEDDEDDEQEADDDDEQEQTSSDEHSDSDEEESDIEIETTDCFNQNDPDDLGNSLPEWFCKCIRNNTISQCYINLYTHQLHFSSPQAEDFKDEDSFLCTLTILKHAFDLLTDFGVEHCTYVSREGHSMYKKIIVGPEHSTPRLLETPYCEMSSIELKECFEHFLKYRLKMIDFDLIKLLPENFQLFMVSIMWWVTYCKVPLSHVQSLFICYLMLDVIDERTGTARRHFHFHNKYSKKLNELKRREQVPLTVDEESLFLNKNKVQYEDCLVAANVLMKHFEMDVTILKKPKSYNSVKMHSFAQLQCCLQQINSLNTLCGSPFESTKYSKCFNGTFIYNIALKLENQIEPINNMIQYLKGADTVIMFYKSLCIVYEKCLKTMNLANKALASKKLRRKKKQLNDDIDEIVKAFEFEVVI